MAEASTKTHTYITYVKCTYLLHTPENTNHIIEEKLLLKY